MVLSIGSKFPSAEFTYIPFSEGETMLTCNRPLTVKTDKALAGKKVIVTGAPGAFTSACSDVHIGPLLARFDEVKAKGVEQLIIVTSNDPFVQSAWRKAFNEKRPEIVFASDGNLTFGKATGLDEDLSALGIGTRLSRFVAVVEDGTVTYFAQGKGGDPTPTTVDAILPHL